MIAASLRLPPDASPAPVLRRTTSYIPLLRTADPMERSALLPPAHASSAGDDRPSVRVVVCDDEPHITLAVSLKLRKAGFEVETHPDGQSAWESVAANPPALIVTDCQMPRMSGLDLIRNVRREPRTTAVPTIMLTGKGFELDDAEMQREMGPVRLFPKPFSPRELLETVAELTAASAN